MSQHVISPKIYFAVFAALLFMTGVTVGVAFLDLGPMNVVIAVTIAVSKALLVVLYFMHVRYSGRLTQVVVGAGFFWLILLVGLTMSDFLTRGNLSFPRGW